jgi:hypothetical protein
VQTEARTSPGSLAAGVATADNDDIILLQHEWGSYSLF